MDRTQFKDYNIKLLIAVFLILFGGVIQNLLKHPSLFSKHGSHGGVASVSDFLMTSLSWNNDF